MYNDVNHYGWSKLLSLIMIKNGYTSIDPKYEFINNLNLLRDFTKILIKYEYYNGKMNIKEATNFLLDNTFLDLNEKSSNQIILEIIDDYSKNNLEYYVSYLYLNTLFNENCIINNKLTNDSFIKEIFKYGFLPVYNYKSILN